MYRQVYIIRYGHYNKIIITQTYIINAAVSVNHMRLNRSPANKKRLQV